MAQPVWVLSVDLQTKTATFTTGLSDAAKSARGSFNEIRTSANEMGQGVSYSTGEARHSVMMLGEEFGVHLPRGLTTFIATLGPLGPALEAAFPFAAIALGATLLIEHLVKMGEAAKKAAEEQEKLGTTVDKTLTGLDDKLLKAGIEADDLAGNHLAALKKELELIDHASLSELMSTFDVFGKAADVTFANLKTSWYQIVSGSQGAKNALDEFKTHYDSLLAQGKNKEAHDLLAGTLESANKSLILMRESATAMGASGINDKQIAAQNALLEVLNAQVTAEGKIAALKAAQDSNATTKTGKVMGKEDDERTQAAGKAAKQAADDSDRAWKEAYDHAVSMLQESERQKIAATESGSIARLAVIDAAIKEENAKGLQATEFYKSLLTDRTTAEREQAKEKAKLDEEMGKESASNAKKMAELKAAAEKEATLHSLAGKTGQGADKGRLAAEEQEAAAIHQAQMKEYQDELAGLDKNGKDLALKQKQINDKMLEEDAAYLNKKKQMEDKALEKQTQELIQAENRMGAAVAQAASKSIMEGQSMAQAMERVGSQMVTSALTNLMQLETVQGRKKLGDAKTAAADVYQWAAPAGPVVAGILAGGAFAAVMAFNKGGVVPGVERGDTVPAMLTPGEGVIPKPIMDNLARASGEGGGGGGQAVHVHHSPTYNLHMIDATGVDKMLQKHGEQFVNHAANEIRRRNG